MSYTRFTNALYPLIFAVALCAAVIPHLLKAQVINPAEHGCVPRLENGAIVYSPDGVKCTTKCTAQGGCQLSSATPEEEEKMKQALSEMAQKLKQNCITTGLCDASGLIPSTGDGTSVVAPTPPCWVTRSCPPDYLTTGSDRPVVLPPAEQPSSGPVPIETTPAEPQSRNNFLNWDSCRGSSIVNCLGNNGFCNSYQCRSNLATYYGIANYAGTAAQNTQLMGYVLDQGVPQTTPLLNPPPIPRPRPDAADLPAPVTLNPATMPFRGSVVDYLANNSQRFDYAYRAQLAAQYGITNYRGTAAQNILLLSYLIR